MPEEEIEYLDDDNENSNEQSKDATRASSKSSLKDTFKKYKSRKNNEDTSNINKKSNTVNNNTIRNRALDAIKNQATNEVLNKASNLHPILKAVSMLNNIKNRNPNSLSTGGVVSRNNGDSSNLQDDNKVNGSSPVDADTNNDDGTSSSDTSSVNGSTGGNILKSLNPLGSLVSGKGGLLGQFSFFGKASLPVKLATILGPLGVVFLIFVIMLFSIDFVDTLVYYLIGGCVFRLIIYFII